jgi:hypothetical protein
VNKPWRERWAALEWLGPPLIAFTTSRALLAAITWITLSAYSGRLDSGPWHAAPDNVLLDVWDRWDSAYYRSIATRGYVYGPGDPGNVAFFPGYPLLLAGAHLLVQRPTLAGILVSNGCFLLALILLYRLCLFEWEDRPASRRALYYLAFFPTSFFFSAVYSESAFLLFILAAFYAARRRWWLAAGIAGALASATRMTGILIYGVLLLEWLRAEKWRRLRSETSARSEPVAGRDWLGLLALHVAPLGLLAYMLFLQSRFGDPLAFFAAVGTWGRGAINSPLAPLWRDFLAIFRISFRASDPYMWRVGLDVAAGLVAIGLTVPIWRRLGPSYALFTLASVFVPLATGTTMSLSRYVAVVFPIPMLLALWGRRETMDRVILVIFAMLLAILAGVFVNWGFVA